MLATTAATVIRPAGPHDLERVAAVLYAAHSEFTDVLPDSVYRVYLANLLDVRSRMQEAQVLAAEHDGRIVGTATFYPDASQEGWGWPADWVGIRAVGVMPAARGLGLGRALAEACIERARALGVETICLHTATFMAAAVAMYERVGFRRVPEFDIDLTDMFPSQPIDPPITVLAYRLDL